MSAQKRRRRKSRLGYLKGLARTASGRFTRRRHRRKRTASNPLVLSNRRHRRRSRRHRNQGSSLVRYFSNPGFGKLLGGGGPFGKVTGVVKKIVDPANLRNAATVVGTIAAAYAVPQRLLPQHDVGVKGLALTAATGALVTAAVGMAMPALVPMALVGTGSAVLIKALAMYARGIFPVLSGIGAFLTVDPGMGQIPAGLIQGGSGLGDFLYTSKPVVAVGPNVSAALGGGERFANFS